MQAGKKKFNPRKKGSTMDASVERDEKEGSTFLTAVGGGKVKKQKSGNVMKGM